MSVFEGDSISADWYMTALLMVVGCIGIGLMEEFLFRGVIFNGLLAVMGKTHRGLMGAIAIVSVLFGLAHLDFTQDLVDPIMWCQAIFKIVQTGMYSVILCTIVLRTRRLGGVSLLHCLSDLALMLPAVALFGESLETEYVTSGEDGIAGIALYAVVCAMYLPFVVRSLRALKRDQDAYRGVFFERALRRKKAKEERKSLRNMPAESDGRPTLPRVTAEDEGRPTLPHMYEEDEGLDDVSEK
jgi:hypothetical protein